METKIPGGWKLIIVATGAFALTVPLAGLSMFFDWLTALEVCAILMSTMFMVIAMTLGCMYVPRLSAAFNRWVEKTLVRILN